MKQRFSTIGVHPFDPRYADQYREGDQIEFHLNGAHDSPLLYGTVRGLSSSGTVIKTWIVELAEPLHGWEYSCVTVQHTFMRLRGSNEPFPGTTYGKAI